MFFNEKVDYQYKILILGDATVGKTSLLIRYIDNKFDEDSLSTLGVDVRYKYVTMNNKKIRLDIWDTAGQERFKNITKNYFKGANAIIFVFDVNKKKTIEKLKFWFDSSDENVSKETVKLIVGNKIDLEGSREVTFEQMKTYGQKYNMEVFEASAKTGFGIPEIFTYLVTTLMKNPKIGVVIPDDESSNIKSTLSLNKKNFKEKKKNEGCNC